ncbi:MAG: hypothetical protein M1581_05165 [Candidatus Thermoplasmatota archaeon]|jgi:DNA-directed RNA polymerase subunit RPC12/RpoP|nr:hypothetical protein [Candidatus Thermoplasmatota archaeon]
MAKMVHIWEVKCKYCGTQFEHIFRADDILRPHIFNDLRFKCIKCGKVGYDPVRSIGKMTLDEWQEKHPELNLEDLPDYSYIDDLNSDSSVS